VTAGGGVASRGGGASRGDAVSRRDAVSRAVSGRMPARPGSRVGLAVVLLVAALVACDSTGGVAEPGTAARAEGEGPAVAVETPAVVLRDGVQAAPGTRVIEPGAGETASGWYAALDLGEARPAEVAAFYREHLAALGFAVAPGDSPLTVVATRPTGPTTQVRVDVVPTAGEVLGFVRLVAQT
jgi:hypothetical protein